MEELLTLVPRAPKWNICWDGMERMLSSFVLPMSRTEQNPVFHGEGDVWTHTKMVCEELVKLEAFQVLTENKQQAVFLAALLHDIGKIPTTRQEDGKWVSPNHSSVGARMARRFLWQEMGLCGTPEKQQLRETVCNLIRWHSVPPHAIDDPDGKRKLLAIAANGNLCPMFSLELLCILSQADVLGRECGDKAHMLEQIAFCAELARESGCYDGPFAFPSAHTQYAYLSGKKIQPDQMLYDTGWGKVILLSGLPGTGKDTWIKENCPALPMISLDEIRKELGVSPLDNQSRVVETARERARQLLRKKQSFVWNATNITPMVRRKQTDLFTAYGASVELIFLETSWGEQLRRNCARADAVPQSVLEELLEKLTLPETVEAERVIWNCV